MRKSKQNNNKRNNKSSNSKSCCKYPLKISRRSKKNAKKSKCIGLDSKGNKKVYDVPRLYSRKECKGKIKGFTMRSSCSAFKKC